MNDAGKRLIAAAKEAGLTALRAHLDALEAERDELLIKNAALTAENSALRARVSEMPFGAPPMTPEERAALVERLRKRAEDEREIQRNNEAVATALIGQRILFEERDGSANSYAVRLGLQHASCAKKDAALARDWEDAAAEITRLSAELAEANAALAWCVSMPPEDVSDASLAVWKAWLANQPAGYGQAVTRATTPPIDDLPAG